jgi:C4-dicarboxylate-specific signal transduction histidine kinase
MVGSAWQRRETVWSPNIRDNPSCNRAVFLRDVPSLTGVALPIFVEDALASVIEFFTRDENARPKRYKPFFDILGVHLGNVLSRQRVSAREHEQALQLAASSKMATLGKLAAGIAHEINDPLSTLYTTIQLLERMQRTSDAFSVDNSARPEHIHLQRAHRGLTQIRKVVSSLQSFSRDSSRDAYTEVSLAILLEHTLDLCAARFANKGISLEIPNIPPTLTVECRESQISQVLLNLLSNAFDAAIETAEKWIRVDTKDDGGMVELGVTDSGTGIDPNLAAKIMSPFFTTKPPGKGTGLGLSIANSIIAEHAGELSIDQSSLNTRFVIKLPKRAGRTTKRV